MKNENENKNVINAYKGYTLKKIYDDVYFIQKDGETIYKTMLASQFIPIVNDLLKGELK